MCVNKHFKICNIPKNTLNNKFSLYRILDSFNCLAYRLYRILMYSNNTVLGTYSHSLYLSFSYSFIHLQNGYIPKMNQIDKILIKNSTFHSKFHGAHTVIRRQACNYQQIIFSLFLFMSSVYCFVAF